MNSTQSDQPQSQESLLDRIPSLKWLIVLSAILVIASMMLDLGNWLLGIGVIALLISGLIELAKHLSDRLNIVDNDSMLTGEQ